MSKDKEKSTHSEKDEPVLTEWQKRNQEFLKKKEQDKAEQEEAEKRLQELRRAQFLGDETAVDKEAKVTKTKPKKVKKKKAKKEPRPKKVKPKNPNRQRFTLVLLVAVATLLFSLFMISPLSTSKTLEVAGESHTTAEAVKEASGIKADDYLTTVYWNRQRIANKVVQDDPWVAKAQVAFEFPNHFTIQVKEYQITAYRLQKDSYYPILSNGQVVDELVSKLPEQFLSVNLKTQKEVATFMKAWRALPKSIRQQIQSVSSKASKSTKDLVELKMYDGNAVLVPLSKMTERLPYYSQVVKKMVMPGVIDMEVGIYVTAETSGSDDTQNTSSEAAESPGN